MVKKSQHWLPARQDIIWIDGKPQVGQEMRDVLCHQPKSFAWRMRNASPIHWIRCRPPCLVKSVSGLIKLSNSLNSTRYQP